MITCVKNATILKREGKTLGTGDWVTVGNLDDRKRRLGFIKSWDIRTNDLFKNGFWVIQRINLREKW